METSKDIVTNEDYVANHPNAIIDRDEAEYVAYRTKQQEEGVKHLANMAELAAQGTTREALEYKRDNEAEIPMGLRGAGVRSAGEYLREGLKQRQLAEANEERARKNYAKRVRPINIAADELRSGRDLSSEE